MLDFRKDRDEYFNECFNCFCLPKVVDISLKYLHEANHKNDRHFYDFLSATIVSKRKKEGKIDQINSGISLLNVALNAFNSNTESDTQLGLIAFRGGCCRLPFQSTRDEKLDPAIISLAELFKIDISNRPLLKLKLFQSILILTDKGNVTSGLSRELYISSETAVLNEKVNLGLINYTDFLAEYSRIIKIIPNYIPLHQFKANNVRDYFKKGLTFLDIDDVIIEYKNVVKVVCEIESLDFDQILETNSWSNLIFSSSALSSNLLNYRLALNLKNDTSLHDYLSENVISYNTLGGDLLRDQLMV